MSDQSTEAWHSQILRKIKGIIQQRRYASYHDQTVSPALLSLFYKGIAFISEFPAAQAKTKYLDEAETYMPGIVNKLVGKYFFSAPCDGGGKNASGGGRSIPRSKPVEANDNEEPGTAE